ncbi:MAG: type IX secretion system membrane protein PorP/SprF [Prevotellaceae bacterium]|nr:type IX secretion system membrane protein PorP/SprF [Prevotellaceae bacterium]
MITISSAIAQIQYMYHKQFTNPAAMGAEDVFNFATYAQLRLYGFDSAPGQTVLQVTVPFSTNAGYGFSDASKNMYIGFTAFVRSTGIHLNYNILASYGYKINLTPNTNLTFALALGVNANSINYQRLLDYDTDPAVAALLVSTGYKLHGQAGAYMQGNKFYFSLYSSSIVSDQNIWLQTGFFTTVGKSDDDGYSQIYSQDGRKNMFEINGQLGYTNNNRNSKETILQAQANTIFTFNNLIGGGIAWEYPLKMAGIATFNLGSIKVSYCYHVDNLDKNLPTHEIFLKVKIKPKTDIF